MKLYNNQAKGIKCVNYPYIKKKLKTELKPNLTRLFLVYLIVLLASLHCSYFVSSAIDLIIGLAIDGAISIAKEDIVYLLG